MAFVLFGIQLFTAANFSDSMKQIEYISKTYFSHESLLVIYWTNVSTEFRDELMNYWIKSEVMPIETCNCDYVSNDVVWDRSYVKNIVVLLGDLLPERRHIESIRQCRAWNARAKILAISNRDDVVNKTLQNIWTFTKALNVTFMVSTTSSVKYYTLYPYDNFKIIELDKTGLFPRKPLNNLHGSVISVATTYMEPYIMIPSVPDQYTEGFELRIILTMAQKFNFKIKYLKPPPGETAWISFANNNRKAVGLLGLSYRCEADILFHGSPVSSTRISVLDLTVIHTMDNTVWVVPKRPFSLNWKSIVMLFKGELWALIWITLILIAIILYLITKYEFGSRKTSYNPFDAFFQAFGIHLGVPIYFYRERQLYRFFITIVSYYTIIIIASYQSSLVTFLTTPDGGNQYDTIEEAIDDGLKGYFFYAAKAALNSTDHELWNKILQPGKHAFLNSGYLILQYVGHNKTVFTLLNREFSNYVIYKSLLDENHEPMVRMLPEFYKLFMVAMYTSRGHPLKDALNDHVLRLIDCGFLDQWKEEILMDELGNTDGVEGGDDEDDNPMALSIEHLTGAFYIIPLMSVVAGVVFIGELVWYWWNVKRNRKMFEILKI